MESVVVWHYTIGECAKSILKTGQINTATDRLYKGEKPVAWFSAHHFYEPTATKTVSSENDRLASFEEMVQAELWRFGVHVERLMHWPKLIDAANIDPEMVNYLVRDGVARGANPLHWYGSLDPVPIVLVQEINRFENSRWVNAQTSDIPAYKKVGAGGTAGIVKEQA